MYPFIIGENASHTYPWHVWHERDAHVVVIWISVCWSCLYFDNHCI